MADRVIKLHWGWMRCIYILISRVWTLILMKVNYCLKIEGRLSNMKNGLTMVTLWKLLRHINIYCLWLRQNWYGQELVSALSAQPSKALWPAKSSKRSHELSIKDLFNIFDKKIVPILTYGPEIWGFEKKEKVLYTESCVQFFIQCFMKHTGCRTDTAVALGECSRM